MRLKSHDFYPNGRIKNPHVIVNNKPGMLLVKAEWCGHCKRFMPTFERLNRRLGNNFPCVYIDESDMTGELARELNVRGFPTIMFFDKYGRIIEHYNGSRDENQLIQKIDEMYHKYR